MPSEDQAAPLSMSEIAYRIGYTRVQEFSRDFRQHFGLTPTQTREQGPQYREIELPDCKGGGSLHIEEPRINDNLRPCHDDYGFRPGDMPVVRGCPFGESSW